MICRHWAARSSAPTSSMNAVAMQDLTVKLIDAGFIYADDSPAAEITAVRVMHGQLQPVSSQLRPHAIQQWRMAAKHHSASGVLRSPGQPAS